MRMLSVRFLTLGSNYRRLSFLSTAGRPLLKSRPTGRLRLNTKKALNRSRSGRTVIKPVGLWLVKARLKSVMVKTSCTRTATPSTTPRRTGSSVPAIRTDRIRGQKVPTKLIPIPDNYYLNEPHFHNLRTPYPKYIKTIVSSEIPGMMSEQHIVYCQICKSNHLINLECN